MYILASDIFETDDKYVFKAWKLAFKTGFSVHNIDLYLYFDFFSWILDEIICILKDFVGASVIAYYGVDYVKNVKVGSLLEI